MRASSQGSFTTLLLLVPVLAVPLFAIFGLPEISTDHQQAPLEEEFPELSEMASLAAGGRATLNTAASPGDVTRALPLQSNPLTEHPQGVPGNTEPPLWNHNQGNDDLKDPTRPADTPSDKAAMAWADSSAPPQGTAPRTLPDSPIPSSSRGALNGPVNNAFAESDLESSSSTRGVIPAGNTEVAVDSLATGILSAPAKTPRKESKETAPLTWQDAVQRLHALQIRNFRLEPGSEPSVFVFICSYTPADNPRISYRFEAEANEPLKAVEKVLQQIEEWSSSR